MPTDCDAIVVSDLHLGRHGKARPKAVRTFFEDLAADRLPWRPRRVVLNGDVFEDLDLRNWKKTHWEALAAIRKVERDWPVTWVRGNHDGPFAAVEFLSGHPKLAEPVGTVVVSAGKKFMVVHGKREAAIGRRVKGLTEREAVPKLRDQWDGYDRHGLSEAVAVARGAIWYARKHGWDAAVCGHTHGPFAGTLDGFPYTNCGSWTKGNPATYAVVAGGRARLCRFDHKAEA